MAQYYSLELGDGVANARTYPVSGVGLGGRTVHYARAEKTLSAAITTSDVLDLFDLPPRARVVDGFVKSSDMDTNGSPTFAWNIGDSGDADRYFAAANAPQTGVVVRMTLATAIDYVTTAKTRVKLVPSANAATFAAGTLVVMIGYIVEEPA